MAAKLPDDEPVYIQYVGLSREAILNHSLDGLPTGSCRRIPNGTVFQLQQMQLSWVYMLEILNKLTDNNLPAGTTASSVNKLFKKFKRNRSRVIGSKKDKEQNLRSLMESPFFGPPRMSQVELLSTHHNYALTPSPVDHDYTTVSQVPAPCAAPSRPADTASALQLKLSSRDITTVRCGIVHLKKLLSTEKKEHNKVKQQVRQMRHLLEKKKTDNETLKQTIAQMKQEKQTKSTQTDPTFNMIDCCTQAAVKCEIGLKSVDGD